MLVLALQAKGPVRRQGAEAGGQPMHTPREACTVVMHRPSMVMHSYFRWDQTGMRAACGAQTRGSTRTPRRRAHLSAGEPKRKVCKVVLRCVAQGCRAEAHLFQLRIRRGLRSEPCPPCVCPAPVPSLWPPNPVVSRAKRAPLLQGANTRRLLRRRVGVAVMQARRARMAMMAKTGPPRKASR